MSSDTAIHVENLGKRYRIGGPQASYSTFRETLTDAFAAPFRRVGRLLKGQGSAADLDQIIWALKDVSFEVKRGEVVGIIGRNGAGKSTLLKILSRITEPTEGKADVFGRVGALLEVGTGFHGELTGRENVYLNGAILGMTRAEIDRKFDEMIEFAGVAKFVDTPVKHYSSGMSLRLGFSVAAFLEPDILLVDEVLAVGDADFQKRCLGKMGSVTQEGRTVFLVSHNLGAISSLCRSAVWLEGGRIAKIGATDEVVNAYISSTRVLDRSDLSNRVDRRGSGAARISKVEITDAHAVATDTFQFGNPVYFSLSYRTRPNEDLSSPIFTIRVHDQVGQLLFSLGTHLTGQVIENISKTGTVRCEVPHLLLTPGEYSVSVLCHSANQLADFVDDVATIFVVDSGFLGGNVPMRPPVYGPFVMPHNWTRVGNPS